MLEQQNTEYKQRSTTSGTRNHRKDGGFQVTIFKESLGGQVGGQVDVTGGQDDGQVSALTERKKEVLKLIVADPKISRKQLAEKLGINESAVQKHTDALKKKGRIE